MGSNPASPTNFPTALSLLSAAFVSSFQLFQILMSKTKVAIIGASGYSGEELVRYLLTWSLSQIESGKHRLPAEPVEKRTLGV